MTGPAPVNPAGPPAPDDLTARVFRAPYQGFDLHAVGGTYIAIPAGTPCFARPSLGEVARLISEHEDQDPPSPPASPAGPC